MTVKLPDRLRLRDGVLVLDDGSDAREYLRDWARRANVGDDTPVNVLKRESVTRLQDEADMRFTLAS